MEMPEAIRATMAGPWGPILVAATRRGVVAVAWLTTEDAFDAALERRLGGAVGVSAPVGVGARDPRQRQLRSAIDAIERSLAGETPPALAFDLADRPEWDRRVLDAVARIPWGRTASYGDIARQIGAPRAARAVGGAVGRNPIGILIPCHRVIAADGTIGGYGGDAWGSRTERLAMKRDLLLREGVAVPPPSG